MENATKITLLRDEYLLLQNFYENFDTRFVTIKGWSATVGMAAIGGGFYQTRYLWLFGAGSIGHFLADRSSVEVVSVHV